MAEFIRVDEWKPSSKDSIVGYDGKLIKIPFDKIFNKPNIEALNTFIIKKESYVSRLPELTHYINYFIKYYDLDNELILSYLKLKFIIDDKRNKIKTGKFIDALYNILFTDSMKSKIEKMVEDNYYIDLSSDNTDKKYDESLEFTEAHAKTMMKISVSMKIMVPVMFHYINNHNLIKKYGSTDTLYRFYERLFDLYDPEIDLYNKLYISAWSKVNVSYLRNRASWDQREIFGVDPHSYMKELLIDKIINETIFKYVFNRNVISFNYVILNKQLGYFLKERYNENRIELSAKKSNIDGLSGLDKLEMNSSKVDESAVVLSELNIKNTIKRIKKKMKIDVTREEIEYYKANMTITKFQTQLIFYYYAKYFGGYRDLLFLTREQYIQLVIILKKRLLFQNYVYLPHILTANIDGRLCTRTIQNNKFTYKIQTSSLYMQMVNDKFDTLEDIGKSNLILAILSTILNSSFTLVDYERPDLYGKKLELNDDLVSEEFLSYINQI